MQLNAHQRGSALAPTCPLGKAVSYENPEVVSRFVQLYDVSSEEAADVYVETRKWLWLASQVESGALSITDPLLIIDEMSAQLRPVHARLHPLLHRLFRPLHTPCADYAA